MGEPQPPGEDTPSPPAAPVSWERHSEGLEFDRVAFFTDAVFAIALTLLVVSMGAVVLRGNPESPQVMLQALADKIPEFVSFFVAFVVIGRYWMAHHRFMSLLGRVDYSFIGLNLIYLAFVAFLPFPTALVGRHEENPVSVLTLALCLAIVSTMETVLFRLAYRHKLFRVNVTPELYRYGVKASLSPVAMFIVTAPLALISSTLTLVSWMSSIPIGAFIDRRAPQGAERITLAAPKNHPAKD